MLLTAFDFTQIKDLKNDIDMTIAAEQDNVRTNAQYVVYFKIYPIIYNIACQGLSQCTTAVDPALFEEVKDILIKKGFEVEVYENHLLSICWR